MKITQAINPKTLLLPSLFLNAVLLGAAAYALTQAPAFFESAPIVVLTNSPPATRTPGPLPAATGKAAAPAALAASGPAKAAY